MDRIPIAAMIDGITNGSVKIDLYKASRLHLYLPRAQAIGRPTTMVAMVEAMACTIVKLVTPAEIKF